MNFLKLMENLKLNNLSVI